jgi:hypothetical protein
MTRKRAKLVHEGEYVAEVELEMTYDDDGVGWSPYLSVQEAAKLDEARRALKRGDIEAAGRIGRVFKLLLVAM